MLKISKPLSILLKLIIIFSVPVLTVVISYNHKELLYRAITGGIAFVIIIILISRIKFEKIKLKELGIILLISSYLDKLLMNMYTQKLDKVIKLVYKYTKLKLTTNITYCIVGILIYFAICFYVYLFIKYIYPKVADFFKKLTKSEKVYLSVVLVFAIIFCTIVTMKTTAFGFTGAKYPYDVIYSSDSNYLVKSDVWLHISNPENDIRQPLFGVFSYPFAAVSHFIADVLFFIPKSFAYEYVTMVMQYFLLGISTILFARLIEKEEKNKKFVFMLFSLSFPYLLFGLVLEQYVVGLFYLTLCIYSFFKNTEKTNYAYIGAVGTLITSGILFFLITKWKGIKDYVVKAFKVFFAFVAVAVLSGQFVLSFNAIDRFNNLMRFTGDNLTFLDKLNQYTYFVRSLFVAPKGFITFDNINTAYKFASYQIVNVHMLSKIGIGILAILLLSLIINRKDKVALFSGFWIIFSFIILCVIGWGTRENGLILYSLYFSWAFYILFYKLFKNKKWLIVPFVLVFFALNGIEIFNILKFSFIHYIR